MEEALWTSRHWSQKWHLVCPLLLIWYRNSGKARSSHFWILLLYLVVICKEGRGIGQLYCLEFFKSAVQGFGPVVGGIQHNSTTRTAVCFLHLYFKISHTTPQFHPYHFLTQSTEYDFQPDWQSPTFIASQWVTANIPFTSVAFTLPEIHKPYGFLILPITLKASTSLCNKLHCSPASQNTRQMGLQDQRVHD